MHQENYKTRSTRSYKNKQTKAEILRGSRLCGSFVRLLSSPSTDVLDVDPAMSTTSTYTFSDSGKTKNWGVARPQ
jgi:hypothetical protein